MKTINLSFAQITIVTMSCTVLGMISVGYVAAQTATSTEETATSTTETAAPSGDVAGTSTTTEPIATSTSETQPTVPDGQSESDTTTDNGPVIEMEVTATTTEEEPEEVSSEDEEAISPTEVAAIGDIAALEQEYKAKYGRYLQVMPGNMLPSHESGTVQSKLGKMLSDNVRIDVYESPHGFGYQISYEENGVVHSVGYGPEAADRTYTIEFPKPEVSATSTPAIQ